MILDVEPNFQTARPSGIEPGDIWRRTLERNLDSIREHRPELSTALAAATEIAGLPACDRSQEERVTRAFIQLESARAAGHSIAIVGIGDGVIVRSLAKYERTLPFGRLQEVNVVEPNIARLLAALGETDLSGPHGAIEQKRFAWYVGESWAEQLLSDLERQPTKMSPQCAVAGGPADVELIAELSQVTNRLLESHASRGEQIRATYAARSDQELLALFSETPPRRPRVLLITSRFTTVLQYSTKDSADAFEQLGWEARVLIEREPWQSIARPAVRAALAEFEPDLVFQIDHLRHEFGDEIPASLPFVCWIQDHLPNLACAAAGESVGARDFVLTGGVYRYVGRHGYPRRQCVDMPKASRERALPTSWSQHGEDLLYVSHWSSTPEQVTAAMIARARETGGAAGEMFMRACVAAVLEIYADGGALQTDLDVQNLVREVATKKAIALEPERERFFVDELFQRLNNTLYRQQALLWAAGIADELGLKFGIYGKGWETHPQLGRFARGVVNYGPELEALTRESKMLLQLEPYACYTHQRMLDCVLAGGFALVRDHPLNTLPIRLRKFLDAHVPRGVNDVESARALLIGPARDGFAALLKDAAAIAVLGDPVDVVRGWQRAGIIGDDDVALPHLHQIAFNGRESLRERILTFRADRGARDLISADQRTAVRSRLTYVSGLSRALKTIHQRLAESIASPHYPESV